MIFVRRKGKTKNVDGFKYFTDHEIKLLRRAARKDAEISIQRNLVTGVRSWMVIDLLTCKGLRVSECANLRCGDLKIGHGQSEIFVENVKGNVSGTVIIPYSLKKHLKSYLHWKKKQGERTGPNDPLFLGQRGQLGAQAIQKIVKKYLKLLGLYQPGKSAHSLRHSYAVELYRKEKDLRTVQKQLRHVSIQSTMIYADVSKEEIAEQLKGLWG